jgi:hypothetical protein
LTELAMGEATSARDHATAAVAALEKLGLTVMTPADRATLAQASMSLGDREDALSQARQVIAILDACRGEGPDFPHREYRRCAEVLAACGQNDEAAAARANAQRLLKTRAAAISDPELRAVFLARSPGVATSLAAASGELTPGVRQEMHQVAGEQRIDAVGRDDG